MGVPLGVLHVDRALDGEVEDQPLLPVHQRPAGGVPAQLGLQVGQERVDGALAVAGGQHDCVGREPAAGVLVLVLDVQLDGGGADAARRAHPHAGGQDGVGPAAVERAVVQLVVDGGDGGLVMPL